MIKSRITKSNILGTNVFDIPVFVHIPLLRVAPRRPPTPEVTITQPLLIDIDEREIYFSQEKINGV